MSHRKIRLCTACHQLCSIIDVAERMFLSALRNGAYTPVLARGIKKWLMESRRVCQDDCPHRKEATT